MRVARKLIGRSPLVLRESSSVENRLLGRGVQHRGITADWLASYFLIPRDPFSQCNLYMQTSLGRGKRHAFSIRFLHLAMLHVASPARCCPHDIDELALGGVTGIKRRSSCGME